LPFHKWQITSNYRWLSSCS